MLGLALAVAFVACFITGLVSHLIQHPLNVGFLSWPARPGWLYRWNQGLHVAAGTAAIPLLLAKLWAVYDQLWTFPPAKTLGHALERLLVAPLVAGSVFLLFTGLANTAHWYPWPSPSPAPTSGPRGSSSAPSSRTSGRVGQDASLAPPRSGRGRRAYGRWP